MGRGGDEKARCRENGQKACFQDRLAVFQHWLHSGYGWSKTGIYPNEVNKFFTMAMHLRHLFKK
jgi:hypothetical protein